MISSEIIIIIIYFLKLRDNQTYSYILNSKGKTYEEL